MALGAERRGIVRLFVFESTLVSVIAGVIGLFLALWTVSIVPKLAGQNIPLESELKLQWPVLIFTLGLSLITGLLMGLYPAWQSSRADLVDGLKEGGRGASGSRGQHRFRRGLVAGASGIIGRAACRSRHVDFQFCPAQPAGSGVPVRPSLGGRNRSSARAISRSGDTRTLRGTIAGGIADRSRRGGRRDHGRGPALWEFVRHRRMHVAMEILCR